MQVTLTNMLNQLDGLGRVIFSFVASDEARLVRMDQGGGMEGQTVS